MNKNLSNPVRSLLAAALFGVLAGGCAPSLPQVTRHEGGASVTLQQLHGNVVLLNYWAVWCPPCMAEIPALIRISAEYQGRVVLLAVNDGDDFYGRVTVERWLSKNPATFTPYIVYGNGALLEKFPRRAFPTTYVLDATGELVEKFEGSISEAMAREAIQRALDRAPGAQAQGR